MGKLKEHIDNKKSLDYMRFSFVKLVGQYYFNFYNSTYFKMPHSLDVGCSDGSFSGMFSDIGFITDAFDITKVDQTDDNYNYNYIIDEMGAENYVFCRRYDFIHIGQVLEHIPNPEELLLNISKYLSSHGLVIISVPNFFLYDGSHLRVYNKNNTRKTVSKYFFCHHVEIISNHTGKISDYIAICSKLTKEKRNLRRLEEIKRKKGKKGKIKK